jgi:hypothetical protein
MDVKCFMTLMPGNASGMISPSQFGTVLHLLSGQLVGPCTIKLAQDLLPAWQELMLPGI